jgi:hypothetical protein
MIEGDVAVVKKLRKVHRESNTPADLSGC